MDITFEKVLRAKLHKNAKYYDVLLLQHRWCPGSFSARKETGMWRRKEDFRSMCLPACI